VVAEVSTSSEEKKNRGSNVWVAEPLTLSERGQNLRPSTWRERSIHPPVSKVYVSGSGPGFAETREVDRVLYKEGGKEKRREKRGLGGARCESG